MNRPAPLLPPVCAAPIFAPLVGRRVGLIHSPATGNVGDRMIEAAAEQLLRYFGIAYEVQEPDADTEAVLLLFGGGNFGHDACAVEAERRQLALATGRPCVLLPQTCYGAEPGSGEYLAAFVRDVHSRQFIPGAAIAPDLAMMYQPDAEHMFAAEPSVSRGDFFSRDTEALWPTRGIDPRHMFSDPGDYLEFVGAHAEIVTDSVHVAICGLMAGRRVTICPTRLHKQRSLWLTWLMHFGCAWADDPDEVTKRLEI